jgi:pilus assembly protein CpaB
MSPGALILGILAVLFGLIGAHGAKKYFEEQKPEVQPVAQPQVTYVTVPLAIRELPEGRTVTVGDITTAKLTKEQIATMALPDSFMNRASEIIGRTLREPVSRSQPFQPTDFYPDGVGPSVADRLDMGERAVTIPYEGVASEAGLVTPGVFVDVLFRTIADAEQMIPETTVTLLENVKVLAVGRETFEGAVAGSDEEITQGSVTLAVSPLQARALKVVEERGTVTLALRGTDDMPKMTDTGPNTLHELLGLREADPPFRTEIYRGGRLTTVIHGADGPQYIEQTPYGMPVAETPQQADTPEVSTQTAQQANVRNISYSRQKPCSECKKPASRSILVRKRAGI